MAQTSTTNNASDEAPKKDDSAGNLLFPIFLKLSKFHVLIVGAGNVGLEKISALLGNSPDTHITILGERVLPALRKYCKNFANVDIVEKSVECNDLIGKQLVIAATDKKEVNSQVKAWATEQGIFCNVADTPDECDFYLGSIVQKGDLKLAISTNGKSPTVAKRLKEVLNESLPDELNDLLQNMPKIRNRLKGNFSEKVRILNELTASLASEVPPQYPSIFPENIEQINDKKWKRLATIFIAAFGLLLIINVLWISLPTEFWKMGYENITQNLDKTFWIFVGAGFLAQLVDGLLGMGYGVTTQIFLMSAGVPLAAISSSIHTAEMFSSGASGFSHYKFGNVNKRLFKALVYPGVVGAVLGAALLSYFGEQYGAMMKPFLAIYAMILGIRILSRAFVKNITKKKVKNVGWLAAAGGFLDSFGGGGWGPLVTSTLIAKGRTPQYVIGSVSLTEFFVTLASALTFFSMIGVSHWQIIAGLIVGGVVAAPISARLAGKLPTKIMFICVGIMVIFWSLRILSKIIF